jgi:hypothetical protein
MRWFALVAILFTSCGEGGGSVNRGYIISHSHLDEQMEEETAPITQAEELP